mgnify:CR=1 FL=1
MAKETDSTILALSQLSNQVAREGGKIVEFKGSGTINQVADLSFFLEREDQEYDPMHDNKLTLNLRKNRRGGAGVSFDLWYQNPGGKVYEI